MDADISRLLKKLHIIVEFAPLHRDGAFAQGRNGKPSVIIVSTHVPDDKIDRVVLHEIGHALNDKNIVGNYKHNASTHICSESGANHYMISQQVKRYIALGNSALTANFVDLARSIGTKDYSTVRKELSKYLMEN